MVINMILINDLKKKIGPSKDYKFKEFIIDRQKVYLIYNKKQYEKLTGDCP